MKLSLKNILAAIILIPSFSLVFVACEDDDDSVQPANTNTGSNSYNVNINMKQLANGFGVSLRNDTIKPYTNKKGQRFNVSRLRYLISDLTFNKSDGTSFEIDGYHFVDISDPSTLNYNPTVKVPQGTYSSISFTFGFNSADNQTSIYPDLNSANWNWPAMLGGGYHYMQLEGKYDSSGTDKFFATHMGTARDMSSTPPTFENNHFVAQPENSAVTVNGHFSIDIEMNVEQWYEDTYEWDFNVYNAPIMPVYDAQKRLNENGPTVFTVKIN